jgi:hypothetical protein
VDLLIEVAWDHDTKERSVEQRYRGDDERGEERGVDPVRDALDNVKTKDA